LKDLTPKHERFVSEYVRNKQNATQAALVAYETDSPEVARTIASEKDRHRVLMNFMHREGWHCSFLEEDCKTSLPFKMTFEFPDKILEIQEGYGEGKVLEDISALEHGISIGRGGLWLNLSPELYRILCQPNPKHRKPPRSFQ
jgi:hypothetical protein